MKYILSLILLVFISHVAFPQMRIIYGIRQDGKDSKSDSIVVYISKESMRITRPVLVKEKQYVDFVNKQTVQTLSNSENSTYVFRKNYSETSQEIVHEYPEILGYHCMKSVLNIRSNKIEVYYTDEPGYKGAPMLYLAEVPGLILKVVRNGNYEIYAKQIDVSDDYETLSKLPSQNLTEISEPVFQQKLIESRYNTYEIFSNENLKFGDDLSFNLNNEIIRASKGTIVLKKLKLPETNKNTIVIAELSVRSNGDAYDRTGSVFAIPVTEKTNLLKAFENGAGVLKDYDNGLVNNAKYEPPLELMRFITSFGTGYFGKDLNISGLNWKDSIVYRLDVSDIIKGYSGKNVYIGTFIGNWDKGGHIISLRLKYFDEPEYESSVKWVMPLFNTLSYLEMDGQGFPNLFKSDTLEVKATIPDGIKNLKLKFFTTGHGDDEFIPRLHKITVDGKEVFNLIPWRTDCASYRDNNPASGNFPNGMSSSDYSRSNWCPGMVVTPFEIKLNDIKTGEHTFKVIIESGDNSYWNVSGSLIGD